MLKNSGMDLTLPLEEKINRLVKAYEADMAQTQDNVKAGMSSLADTMTFKNYSLDELTAMFNLEAYHVNESVQKVVGHLENNKNSFARIAGEINQLAANYIELLRAVDKIGTPASNEYTIDVKFGIPKVEAIDRLKKGGVPMAKRRGLAELKDLLMERHGTAVGTAILALILFIAVFMDMSDPILYAAMVARWGRRDRHFLNENMKRFQAWEDHYVRSMKSFFVRPDVRPVLPKLPCPKKQVYRNIYNYFLEEMDPQAKDEASRGWFEIFRFWFYGLFLDTRLSHVEGYNARQTVIRKYLKERKTYAPRLLNRIFPGIFEEFTIGVDHFDTLHQKAAEAMRRNEKRFQKEFTAFLPQPAVAESEPPEPADAGLDQVPKRGAVLKKLAGGGWAKIKANPAWPILKTLLSWGFRIFLAPLSPPSEPSPLTRISWIRDAAESQVKSREQINTMAEFLPSLIRLLVEKLPCIQKETATPLTEGLKRIPNWRSVEKALGVSALQAELVQIEQGLKETLGLSQFQGFRVSEEMVHTIIESTGIDEISTVYLHRGGDDSLIEARIDRLEERLKRAYFLVKELVEKQDTLIFTLTKIRRDYLSPINTTLSKLDARARIEEAIGLSEIKDELMVIEKCLLELWELPTSSGPATDLGDDVPDPASGINQLIPLMIRNESAGKFDLVQYVKKLEDTTAAVRKNLDAAIYPLTMIDKITSNVQNLLGQTTGFLEGIFAQDAQLMDIQLDGEEIDQKKINFMEDNRFYFRSVPLQVESIRARLDKLVGGRPNLLESHSVEMARTLEKQSIMLRYFLNNALDYLEGRRDGIGLTAELAELKPKATAPDQPMPGDVPTPPQESNDIHNPEPATESLLLDMMTSTQLMDGVRKASAETKRILLEISLKEWDLLKQPIPPQDLLQEIQRHQLVIDKAWQEEEQVLATLEEATRQGLAGDEPPFGKMVDLYRKGDNILKKLRFILRLVSRPGHIDRRLTRAAAIGPAETLDEPTRRRHQDRGQEESVSDSGSSRRQAERTVIKSGVELTVGKKPPIHGQTRDISVRGICFEADTVPVPIEADTTGRLRLSFDPQGTQFPCKVLRRSGPMVILTFMPGYEAQFVALVRREVVQNREDGTAGVLDLQPPSASKTTGDS